MKRVLSYICKHRKISTILIFLVTSVIISFLAYEIQNNYIIIEKSQLMHIHNLNSKNFLYNWKKEMFLPFMISALIISILLTIVLKNIIDLRSNQKELELRVKTDPLTNLPNRRYLFDFINKTISLYKSGKGGFSIYYIDLNGFKDINDSFGHGVGDIILKETANRLLNCLEKGDLAARIGGDEFVLLIKDVISEKDVNLILEKLDKVFSEPANVEGHTINISLSIGVAFYPSDGDNPESLLSIADTKMYKNKKRLRLK